MQSVPSKKEPGAYLLLRLTLDGNILTGTYHEQSMPEGPFKGKGYYGALQLVLDEDGMAMHGKWVGLDTHMNMQNGKISIVRVDKNSGSGLEK